MREKDIWTVLYNYWQAVLPYFEAKLDVEEHALALVLALGKLERNLIAGLYDIQAAARCVRALGNGLAITHAYSRLQTARAARTPTSLPAFQLYQDRGC